jgi:hypothetical protein
MAAVTKSYFFDWEHLLLGFEILAVVIMQEYGHLARKAVNVVRTETRSSN